MKNLLILLISLILLTSSIFAQILPDFEITPDSITFSNPNPIEGEEITIAIRVKNIGEISPTMNEDLLVNLYEGEPKTHPLRIMCRAVIIGLNPGATKTIRTQWRPPAGTTEIFAIANPKDDEKQIIESNFENNIASKKITAQSISFPIASDDQIRNAIKRGVSYIRSQRGRHSRTCLQCGTENQLIKTCVICQASLKGLPEDLGKSPAWDFGEDSRQETAIALLALMSAGVPTNDPDIVGGLGFLMSQDWNLFAVYHHAIIIPTLVATNDPKYRDRAQFAIDQIVKKQLPIGGDDYSDPRDDGGWGYGATADGAHMNMVIYALYAGKQWGLKIPIETWERAEKWIRRNQTESGGWLYNLVDEGSPWAIGVYGSMTATGLWALRACGVPIEEPQIQKGLTWLKNNWTITRNPGSASWLYYYLLALQRFADIPPRQEKLVGHDWYSEIANMLINRQEPNGRWIDHEDYFPTTCFALLFLTRSLPKPLAPDLGAVDQTLRISPPSPRVGEPIRISVTIANTGKSIDAITKVNFYNGDPDYNRSIIESQKVIFTPTLFETTVSIDWAAKSEGEIELFAVVDPDQKLEDLNRENNLTSQLIKIRPKSAKAIDENSPIRKLSDGKYQIGDVIVDVEKREVAMKGEINIVSDDTILEFFATGKLGKTHESLMIISAEPIHIQMALLRLKLNPGMNLTAQGDPHTPIGSPVEIWIEWEILDRKVRRRAEELVWDSITDQPMPQTNWIFTGARIIRNQFTAQLFYNVIALHRDPDSIFNHPLEGGIDDRTYRVNVSAVPPKGTPINIFVNPI